MSASYPGPSLCTLKIVHALSAVFRVLRDGQQCLDTPGLLELPEFFQRLISKSFSSLLFSSGVLSASSPETCFPFLFLCFSFS